MATEAVKTELTKLEGLFKFPDTNPPVSKGKSPPITQSLDNILFCLENAKAAVAANEPTETVFQNVVKTIEQQKKQVEDRQKEIHGSLTKLGKAIDKKFPNAMTDLDPLFSSHESKEALSRVIANHLVRIGSGDVADVFQKECGIEPSLVLRRQLAEMATICDALRAGDVEPALSWVAVNAESLRARSSPLEFYLHRSQFVRILLSPPTEHMLSPAQAALKYGQAFIPHLYVKHEADIRRLLTAMIYLPRERLAASPYSELCDDEAIHGILEPIFMKEFCVSVGLSRQLPLRIAGDIGGNGALARIEKGKKLMRDRKSEWSQTGELMIEIPLAPQHRYHSIFTCPVTKEQATEKNPPMMLKCGHAVAKESLARLAKSSSTKCPYCPTETTGQALELHF